MRLIFKLIPVLLTWPLLFMGTLWPAGVVAAAPQALFRQGQVVDRAGLAPSSFLMASTSVVTTYLPLVQRSDLPPIDDWLAYVNYSRKLAGVPPVTDDATLNDNCFQHARYMAENSHLTHDQNPDLPWASSAGQICAQGGNAWMGSTFSSPIWQPHHSIEGWMSSTGHRLWLLYPTTPTFGYGFYTAANNRAAAALDVLSRANFGADTTYTGWPIRYPGPDQIRVPATKYPITLNWRYFGPAPTVTSTSLNTAPGTPIPHTADIALPVGHKGIRIVPNNPLPDDTTFIVTVTGTYESIPFSYTWRFSTGDTSLP